MHRSKVNSLTKNTQFPKNVPSRSRIDKIKRIQRKGKVTKTVKMKPLKNFIIKSVQKSYNKSDKVLTTQEKKDIEIEDIASTLSLALTILDTYLQSPEKFEKKSELEDFLKNNSNEKNANQELRKMYLDLIKRFLEMGELEECVIYHAWCLNKKAVQILKKNGCDYSLGENLLVFTGCLYLSIKLIIDTEKWFIEDFCLVSGFSEDIISKMDICLVNEILNFEYYFPYEKVKDEIYWLKRFEIRKNRFGNRRSMMKNSFYGALQQGKSVSRRRIYIKSPKRNSSVVLLKY